MIDQTANKNSSAYVTLRAMLINSDFPPGQKLQIEAIMELIGAGRTPIREALFQLCAENIVEFRYQRGFYASEISLEDVSNLITLKNTIEKMLINESLSSRDDNWEDNLILSHYRLKKKQPFDPAADYSANRDWIDNHRKFHASLVSGSLNKVALKTYSMIEENLDRYRSFSFRFCSYVTSNKSQNKLYEKVKSVSACDEHTNIFDLAVNRKSKELCTYLHEHNLQTLNIYKNYISSANLLNDKK